MLLRKLKLLNFRNFEKLELEFNLCGNLLFGNNGQGKTNLLEAIYYLSFFRSFRKGKSQELVSWNEAEYLVDGLFESENEIERNIEVRWKQGNKKQIFYENERIPKLSALVGIFPTVVLSPESLEITQGQPGERRRFLDLCLSIVDKEYLQQSMAYKRVVKQRNSLLRSNSAGTNKPELESWDEKLIEHGTFITKKRHEAVTGLNDIWREMYRKISGGHEDLTVEYKSSVRDKENIEESFIRQLEESRNEERIKQRTLTGPHRDDLKFYLDGRDSRKFGSQGQHKTILLALKAGEMSYISSRKKFKPAILLDDLFALLDPKRIMAFLAILKEYDQFFITANVGLEPERLLSDAGFDKSQFSQFNVKGGKIERKQ